MTTQKWTLPKSAGNRGILFSLIFLLFAIFLSGGEPALEIRTGPEQQVYLFETNSRKGYHNLLIQNIMCINRSNEMVILEKMTIELYDGQQLLQSVFSSRRDLDKTAGRMQAFESRGLLKLYAPFLGIDRLMKAGDRLSLSTEMQPRTGILSMGHYLTVRGIPDKATIRFSGRGPDGKPVEAGTWLEVSQYRQANSFIFPVRGAWYVASSGDALTGHRWVGMEAFALDLGQLGADGRTFRGSGERVEDYHCFGREVVAIAGGEVVRVLDGLADDNGSLKKRDESDEAYAGRVALNQMKLLKENPGGIPGNTVVIRHSKGEYSVYGHLKQGSIRIKKGERVEQGQVIGLVGHTGNSTEPHLHFSVNNGPDLFNSRSLPVVFSNIKTLMGEDRIYLHGGDVVFTAEQ
jgi:hypothetical protein